MTINDKRIIRPVANHFEMVLTLKNLNNRQTLSRIVDCYLQLDLKRPGCINQQSLLATLMLVARVANQFNTTPLVAIRQLYNLEQQDLIREMQTLEFDHESKDGQFLQNFITVAEDDLNSLRAILRFILQVHSTNVLSQNTKQYDMEDKNRILLLSTAEVIGKSYYAQLLFRYFQTENPDIYLDCMAQNTLLNELSEGFSGGVYIAMTTVKLNELDGLAIYQAEKVYSAISEDPKLLFQAGLKYNSGTEIPTYRQLKDYCEKLPIKQLRSKYLEVTEKGIQEVVITKENQVKVVPVKLEKFVEEQHVVSAPAESNGQSKQKSNNSKLKQHFGFGTEFDPNLDGWL